MKLDLIVWYDETDDIYFASAVSDEAAKVLGKLMEPDKDLSCGCIPLADVHPQELVSSIPKNLTIHLYDRGKDCLRDMRSVKNPLQ